MKKLLFIFFLSCAQPEPPRVQDISKKLEHSLDSIERHYDQVERLVRSGYTYEQADSILK